MLDVAHVGLMGFCMGGMYCFNSVRSAKFAKIASFYGMIRLPEYWRSPSHREPLDYLRAGNAGKVLAIIGTKDPYTPANDVAALRATGAVVREYGEADHGFAHDSARPAHRADDARDAFDAARAWLTPAN
jgi:dienelactone hydrolase